MQRCSFKKYLIYLLTVFLIGTIFIYISLVEVSTYHDNVDLPEQNDVGHDKEIRKEQIRKLFERNDIYSKDDSVGYINTEEDIAKRQKGYDKYAFNLLVSDRIGYDRIIPDTRNKRCITELPDHTIINLKASIVICFHKEEWSTLLRTVSSIVNNTPKKLLHEIILLDDFSQESRFIHEFPPALKRITSIGHVLHSKERLGLIRGRLAAARNATGDVLLFLDSHCEVNIGWLEPLLFEITKDSHTVVCPVVDIISPHTFTYKESPIVKGGFTWGMHFSWDSMPGSKLRYESDAYDTPTMPGGLFAMSREYFFQLGGYDEHMNIWGAENLEISFRIWMCGGKLKIVPCSRVGHVFRDRRPYGNGHYENPVDYNAVRLVEVWLDDYKQRFYDLRKDLVNAKVDVKERLLLRQQLGCKSFQWYLENVYPEMLSNTGKFMGFDDELPSIVKKGKMESISTSRCMDIFGEVLSKKMPVILKSCSGERSWSIYSNREISIRKKYCLDSLVYTENHAQVYLMKCHREKAGQEWIFDYDSQIPSHLYNPSSGMCLSADEKNKVVMEICDVSSNNQKWQLVM